MPFHFGFRVLLISPKPLAASSGHPSHSKASQVFGTPYICTFSRDEDVYPLKFPEKKPQDLAGSWRKTSLVEIEFPCPPGDDLLTCDGVD